MTRAELLKMIEDEVTLTVSEPLKEPVTRPTYAPPKPVLNNEQEVDEYLFRAGNKKQ
jgi:hypothetical protein